MSISTASCRQSPSHATRVFNKTRRGICLPMLNSRTRVCTTSGS